MHTEVHRTKRTGRDIVLARFCFCPIFAGMAKNAIIILSAVLLLSLGGNLYQFARQNRLSGQLKRLQEIPKALQTEIDLIQADRKVIQHRYDSLARVIANLEQDLADNQKELDKSKKRRNEALVNARRMSDDERLDDVAKRLSKVPKTP